MAKKLSLVIMALFYLGAGLNHFHSPENYYKIIPPFFSHPQLINNLSGAAEIFFGILLFIKPFQKWACYGIIIMLIAFFPVHIYMLKTGWCIGDICFPGWALWVRLIILQPLLIYWAWANANNRRGLKNAK